MPAAASTVVAMPINLSGVIAEKNPLIHSSRPCGPKSSALTAVEATPIRTKVMMNRGDRMFCMSPSRYAFGGRPEDHGRGRAAVDRLHRCRGIERNDEALRLAVDGQKAGAAGFGERIRDRDLLRLVGDDKRRRHICADAKADRASRGIARCGDRDVTELNTALPGRGLGLLNGFGTERLHRFGNIRRRNHFDRRWPGGNGARELPARSGTQHDRAGEQDGSDGRELPFDTIGNPARATLSAVPSLDFPLLLHRRFASRPQSSCFVLTVSLSAGRCPDRSVANALQSPPILQTIFHSSAVTGCTERSEYFTSAMAASFLSALIAAIVTGFGNGFSALMSTQTNLPVLSVGSG